jgi:hypothetical protein
MNKKKLILIIFAIAIKHLSSAQNKLLNLARIIEYEVAVKEINEVEVAETKNILNETEKNKSIYFIDQKSFNQFATVIKKQLNDKNAFAMLNGKKVTMTQFKNKFLMCDTLELFEFDNTGKEYIVRKQVCDETIINYKMKKIRFTESWFIDPATYELKKEVLAYELLYEKSRESNFWVGYTIYKNQDAYNLIQSYY